MPTARIEGNEPMFDIQLLLSILTAEVPESLLLVAVPFLSDLLPKVHHLHNFPQLMADPLFVLNRSR